MKIEISENNSEQSINALFKFTKNQVWLVRIGLKFRVFSLYEVLPEIFDLWAKDEEAKLSVGEKNDEEHDGEAAEIFGRSRQSFAQLVHCRIERNIFEQFQPRKKHNECHHEIILNY